MPEIEIKRRTIPDRLAYLAAKLREGDIPAEAVALALEVLADEIGTPDADIWIVIVEDRHAAVEALPFSSEDRAVEFAREQVRANAVRPESVRWLTDLEPASTGDDMVFLATYGDDGSDSVSVVRQTLDGEQ